MERLGPQLDALTHRLADCPAEFFSADIESASSPPKRPAAVDLLAMVCDHFRDLQASSDERRRVLDEIAALDPKQQRLIAITVWLLRDPWFLTRSELRDGVAHLLVDGLRPLADAIKPELTVSDVDRREELVRLVLRELGFRPKGETIAFATDRLNTLDSVERLSVVRKTRRAEARARKIREQMAQQRAAEAAARYSPE